MIAVKALADALLFRAWRVGVDQANPLRQVIQDSAAAAQERT
jgi:hypothetical protein